MKAGTAQQRLVEMVVESQLECATVVSPPHFFCESAEVLDLNLELIRIASDEYADGLPIRPVIAAPTGFLSEPELVPGIALELKGMGITAVDLRLSPLGGGHEGRRKIRTTFEILHAFREKGLDVTLGFQGEIGDAAVALGSATSFSTGIGMREQYNYKRVMRVQRNAASSGGAARGAVAGVYLPNAAVTVPRDLAKMLYEDAGIRSRLFCDHEECSGSIGTPARDPRAHYLHCRTKVVQETLARPVAWRPMFERERLERSRELRTIINSHHLPEEKKELKTRTLEGLIALIDDRVAEASA